MNYEPLPVYLVHWNAPDWLLPAARSFAASDIPVRLTVVDNGPKEASKELDERLPDGISIIRPKANVGYSGGANVGIRDWLAGSSDWCVVGSHDLHVKRDTLRLLLEAGLSAPSYGIIGPATTTNALGRLIETNGLLETRAMVSGVCLLLRRQCITQIGLFDEDFGSYGEDDELCHRAYVSGWHVGIRPDAEASGLGSIAPDKPMLQYRNSILLALKTRGRLAAIRKYLAHVHVLLLSFIRQLSKTKTRASQPIKVDGGTIREDIRHRARAIREATPYLLKPIHRPTVPND